MIGGRSRDMILTIACSLLIFSILEVKSQDGCSYALKNIAVQEGTVNTLIDFPENYLEIAVYATTDASNVRDIVDRSATLNPDYEAEYAFDDAFILTIKNATTTAEPGHQISTAGLYLVKPDCLEKPTYKFKFLVVREGPTCSCTRVDSESVQLTCSSIYADHELYPINAIFTLLIGETSYATDTPSRTSYDSSTYISTSAFTINYAASSTYQCNQTFSQPLNADPQFADNAPEFNQQCSFVCPPPNRPPPPPLPTPPPPTPPPPPPPPTTTTTTEATTTEPTTTTSTQSPAPTPGGTPPGKDCSKTRQCQPESGTDNTGIYMKRVVKAQLYTRSDKCCPGNHVCGVVVTLQNGSRYLIHDTVCNDNSLNLAVVAASCMSSDWKLVSEKKISMSNVGAFAAAGNLPRTGSIIIPWIQPCNAMMRLP